MIRRTTFVLVIALIAAILVPALSGMPRASAAVSGTVRAWGSNDHGQLGDNTTTDRHLPVQVMELPGAAVAVAAGEGYSLCIRTTTHTITSSVTGSNGTISPLGAVTVNDGEDQTFNISPDPHYHLADVVVDGSSVGAQTSYTFHDVKVDHTISASFAMNTPLVTSISPTSGPVGTTVTIIGTDFGSSRGSSYVKYVDKQCASGDYVSWSDIQVEARVPSGATGTVAVTLTTAGGA